MYHYAGNNPVKYTDPDGKSDFDFIEDSISGFSKWFNVIINSGNDSKPIEAAKDLSEFMNEKPEFWGVLGGAGLLGGLAYTLYDKNKTVNSFVNRSVDKLNEVNELLLDNGIDIAERSYTYKRDSGFILKLDFSEMNISFKTATFATDGITIMPFNTDSSMKAHLGFSVTVDFQDAVNNSSLNYFNFSIGINHKF